MNTTYLSLVITMLFWGGTFIAGRLLGGELHPAESSCLRFAIASVTLAVAARIIDGRIAIPERKLLFPLFLLGLTGVLSYNLCFFTGLQYIEAGRASLIIALNPIAISLGAALFLKEPLAKKQYLGLLLSLVGALFVLTNGHPERIISQGFGRGELAILGCVASWAAYSLIGRGVLRSLSPLAAVFYSAVIGTVLLLPVALMAGSTMASTKGLGDIGWTAWGSLVFLGVFGTSFGFTFYYLAIKRIGATRSAVFINLVPLFSSILGWLMLGESMKMTVIAGGLLVIAGVTLTSMAKKA